jgi:hypothetical protein
MGKLQQLQGFLARLVSQVSQLKGLFVAHCKAVARAVLGLFGNRHASYSRRELAAVQGSGGVVKQAAYDSTAFVVSLRDFEQRVVQDFVMAPKDYVTACGGSGVSRGSMQAGFENRWLAQFN